MTADGEPMRRALPVLRDHGSAVVFLGELVQLLDNVGRCERESVLRTWTTRLGVLRLPFKEAAELVTL